MTDVKNEKGYTLLLTLLIIIVIIIFFSSFALGAMNQLKQVGQTDSTYEVTAIAEMGVEYYQAKVEYAMEVARLKIEILKTNYESIVKDKLTEAERNQLKRKLDEEIKKVKSDLKLSIEGYQFINPEKNLGEYSEKFFRLTSQPKFDGDILKMNVLGNIQGKVKNITVHFNFPPDLGPTSSSFPPDKSDNVKNLYMPYIPIIETPDFSKIILNPFPSSGYPKCAQNVTARKCITTNISNMNNYDYDTVYYSDATSNKVMNDGYRYKISNLYSNGDLKTGYISTENLTDIHFYVDGFMSFGEIGSPYNFSFVSTKGANFQGINANNNKIYVNDVTNFNNTASLTNSEVWSKGTANFQQIDLINTKLELKNSATFNNFVTMKAESIINLAGPATFKVNLVTDNSSLNIYSTSTFKNVVDFKNKSKLNIAGPATFEVNLTTDNSTLNIYNNSTFQNGVIFKNKSNINIIGTSNFSNNLNISNSIVNFSDKVTAPAIDVKNNSTVCFRKAVSQTQNWGSLLNIDSSSNVYMDESLGTTYSIDGKQPIFLSKKELEVLCPSGEKIPSEPSPVVEKSFINKIIYK